MAKLYNRVRMTVSGTPGVGTITLAAAFSNAYCSFSEAGVANADVVAYFVEDGTDFEIGIGTYTSAGTTLSRDTVVLSKIGGVAGTTKLTLTSGAIVYISPRKEDLLSVSETQSANLLFAGPSSGAAAAPTFRALATADMLPTMLSNLQNFRNIVGRNGGLEVWQRGAGSSANIAVAASTVAYTADGWYISTGANQACHVAAIAGIVTQSQLAAQVQRDSGQTGVTTLVFAFPLDTDELYKLRGNNVLLSFTVSTGANWSPTNGTLTCNLFCGTGAVGRRAFVAYTGETNPLTVSTNLSQSAAATRVISSVSSAVGTNITQAELQFSWTPVGTAGANDWFAIDDVQVEVVPSGSSGLTPNFERASFDVDMLRCKRHYQKSFNYGVAPAQNNADSGQVNSVQLAAASVQQGFVWMNLPVEMRVTPTITLFSPDSASAQIRNQTRAADWTGSAASTQSSKSFRLIGTPPAGSLAGDGGAVCWVADGGI